MHTAVALGPHQNISILQLALVDDALWCFVSRIVKVSESPLDLNLDLDLDLALQLRREVLRVPGRPGR